MDKPESEWCYYDRDHKTYRELKSDEINKINSECQFEEAEARDLFVTDHDTIFISLADLVPTRARIDGIINGAKKMREAKNGLRDKRKPISVRFDHELGAYIVLDGNSTLFICARWGLDKVPCTVED